ncbi:glucosyl-dolichyl phosphate glucuronosyltransferase [Halanaeroarchaeum sulfurireducens]|uniref:Glycosyl transferase family 2 n=1 Tax=Halanaeroarchaeum sulfurireducens TaxID=1604004 RepID=A0A0F7PCV4_9EURY|nr:glucosyl-dolichyl phosphate glucuronosyltransferase [Halanaeroarchaeum sulfurireducens]AKH98000.1 glycosyl transferase family 2 [Halanaeroarchaeum sulfurireducens]ALG82394.1 glycosyl transferase family 2 [Halanaeroarchaeum sulfurireducens]
MVDLVSVVICTYDMERYPVFSEAIESVREQTYEPIEIVLVIDGNEAVYERTVEDYGDVENISIYNNEENKGISYSRTRGGELASGDVVAFIDDDAVAEPDWIETLVDVYETTDAIAAGGDVRPNWQTEKPAWFPAEFYWLVGVVEPGFAEDGEEVRNVYGSNISYRREAFLEVGGYDPKTGRKGDKHLQAHEAPVGIRLLEEYGRGMVFVEDAVVHHTLFDYRGDFGWLVSRSFWQGYSKRVMDLLYPDAPDSKSAYLEQLLTHFVPKRVQGLVRRPSVAAVLQLVMIFVFTGAVGLGYLYAVLQPNLLEG